jgi:hypothetical protein
MKFGFFLPAIIFYQNYLKVIFDETFETQIIESSNSIQKNSYFFKKKLLIFSPLRILTNVKSIFYL